MSKKKESNVATNEAAVNETTTKYEFRFTITVASLKESIVIDNETNKKYVCKNVWYQRDGFKRFYVNVASVETKQMKDNFSFPWSAEILENGKLRGSNPVGMTHQTNLAGKQGSLITEDMFV